jgi:hypothetical protein
MIKKVDAIFYKNGVEVFRTDLVDGSTLYEDKWPGIAQAIAFASLFRQNIEVDRLVVGDLDFDLTPVEDFEWFTFE